MNSAEHTDEVCSQSKASGATYSVDFPAQASYSPNTTHSDYALSEIASNFSTGVTQAEKMIAEVKVI